MESVSFSVVARLAIVNSLWQLESFPRSTVAISFWDEQSSVLRKSTHSVGHSEVHTQVGLVNAAEGGTKLILSDILGKEVLVSLLSLFFCFHDNNGS